MGEGAPGDTRQQQLAWLSAVLQYLQARRNPDTYLQLFLGSPLKTSKRKLKDTYCLHFNFQVYKKYFIILIQREVKHLSFLNERSPCSG